MSERCEPLYNELMNNTALADFFAPATKALSKARYAAGRFQSLPMEAFCLFGCLRHLQGIATMREQIQQLFHLAEVQKMPVARSKYSDALSSKPRQAIVRQTVAQLVELAREQLPDRLVQLDELSGRPIYAADASYQKESAHFGRCTPKQGGEDNHKGHMMLTFYDVRLGAPVDVRLETRNQHEMLVFKHYGTESHSLLQQRRAPWVVDCAFVDMSFWDQQKRRYRQTIITRWKDKLVLEDRQDRPFDQTKINEGVIADAAVN